MTMFLEAYGLGLSVIAFIMLVAIFGALTDIKQAITVLVMKGDKSIEEFLDDIKSDEDK